MGRFPAAVPFSKFPLYTVALTEQNFMNACIIIIYVKVINFTLKQKRTETSKQNYMD